MFQFSFFELQLFSSRFFVASQNRGINSNKPKPYGFAFAKKNQKQLKNFGKFSFFQKSQKSQRFSSLVCSLSEQSTEFEYSQSLKYSLQKYQRSNQDTLILQRPMVREGDWIQSGDLVADCASSLGGELSLGKNIFIAYMPWEGYNYEDAILLSQRLVSEDIYTSVHIESYEVETRTTKLGKEQITKKIPDIPESETNHLDERGIVKLGTFVKEGQILVGKVTPIQKKYKSAYEKLLYTILEKQLIPMRDSSLRTPKGYKAKVIEVKILQFSLSQNEHSMSDISPSFFSGNDGEGGEQKFFGRKKKISKIPEKVQVYLAEKRKIQVGDKMAGRHGNKGIVSQILPREDMPFLPDGTPLDMVLNPLGVPSRMNVGQIYECLLGLASKYFKQYYRIRAFDEIYGPEASRSLTFSKLYEARLQTNQKWLFNPCYPGKMQIFDGRTGEPYQNPVTVGIAYMLKLVHLVDDKIHCLTPDHDVLTTNGWLPIDKITTEHKVATLEPSTGQLVYQNPLQVFHYPQYNGDLYHIKNSHIDLLVTLHHRMFVKHGKNYGKSFADYKLIEAKDIFAKHYKYLKNAQWVKDDYQFTLPAIISNSMYVPECKVHMDDWLTFFGILISQGCEISKEMSEKFQNSSNLLEDWWNLSQDSKNFQEDSLIFSENGSYLTKNTTTLSKKLTHRPIYQVQISQCKQHILDLLRKAIDSLGYEYRIVGEKVTIYEKQLWTYLRSLSLDPQNKSLPSWVWELSQTQAQTFLNALCLADGISGNQSISYYTSSNKLADDLMRLALHAGWSGNKYFHRTNQNPIEDCKVLANSNIWRISLIKGKNNPDVNNGSKKEHDTQIEEIFRFYNGSVHCLSVPNEVFYVRRNGLPVWTGNSRSTGPYSLVTQQPLRGRSKYGGQRLGEMEVWAIEAYGAAFILLEMLTIKSDDISGRMTLWSNILLNMPIYIGTPESFKVLICELQALCLDMGLFQLNKKGFLTQIEHLMQLP